MDLLDDSGPGSIPGGPGPRSSLDYIRRAPFPVTITTEDFVIEGITYGTPGVRSLTVVLNTGGRALPLTDVILLDRHTAKKSNKDYLTVMKDQILIATDKRLLSGETESPLVTAEGYYGRVQKKSFQIELTLPQLQVTATAYSMEGQRLSDMLASEQAFISLTGTTIYYREDGRLVYQDFVSVNTRRIIYAAEVSEKSKGATEGRS